MYVIRLQKTNRLQILFSLVTIFLGVLIFLVPLKRKLTWLTWIRSSIGLRLSAQRGLYVLFSVKESQLHLSFLCRNAKGSKSLLLSLRETEEEKMSRNVNNEENSCTVVDLTKYCFKYTPSIFVSFISRQPLAKIPKCTVKNYISKLLFFFLVCCLIFIKRIIAVFW